MEIVRASARITGLECRESGHGDGSFTMKGLAAVYGSNSHPIPRMWDDPFIENIRDGAFIDVLSRQPDVPLIIGHDMAPTNVLARTVSNTLELRNLPGEGLGFWARIAPTTVGNDIRVLVERGDLSEMSFAFTVGDEEWIPGADNGLDHRDIVRVADLYEISIVVNGAYSATSVEAERKKHALAEARARGLVGATAPARQSDAELVAPAGVGELELAKARARVSAQLLAAHTTTSRKDH